MKSSGGKANSKLVNDFVMYDNPRWASEFVVFDFLFIAV